MFRREKLKQPSCTGIRFSASRLQVQKIVEFDEIAQADELPFTEIAQADDHIYMHAIRNKRYMFQTSAVSL